MAARKIVGLDGAAGSLEALRWALDQARHDGDEPPDELCTVRPARPHPAPRPSPCSTRCGRPRPSLEWATSCPPPRHNFTELPRIRSGRPAFELHYPQLVERFRTEAHSGTRAAPSEVVAQRVGREEQPDADPRSR